MPLNPTLYSGLVRHFKHVRIFAEGQPLIGNYSQDWSGRIRLKINSPGEYYAVDCPFCNDARGRLWINHRWGVFDPQTKTCNRWLAHCYNENCLSEEANRRQLCDWIAGAGGFGLSALITAAVESPGAPQAPIPLPDDFVRIDQLGSNHPSVQYLASRSFDAKGLAADWNIGYSRLACRWSRTGRLVIPVYRGTGASAELYGWQARAIEAGDDPKYYTAQGMKKSQILYGLHRCHGTGPVVICEGPTDVWRVGPNAVALLGKSISAEQVSLIHQHLAGRALVLLLDGDAHEDALQIRDRLTQRRRMSLLRPDPAPVVVATLTGRADPADCSPEQLRRTISIALSAAGRDAQ